MDNYKGDYYRQERKEVEALIPPNSMRILDVGCGEGVLGKRLLEKGVKEVVGIEINPDACINAGKNLSSLVIGDIEEIELDLDEGHFDCVVLADVLEHLNDPLSALKKLRKYVSDSGSIVASIPNIRYWGIINMLIEGHWKYEDYGILDKTHLRFFTKKEIEKLFADSGFHITAINANIDPRYHRLDDASSGELSFGRVLLKNLSDDDMRDLFVVQYLIRADKVRPMTSGNTSQLLVKVETGTKKLKKIAIVRGANLNKWEMQNYEPLSKSYDLTAYTTSQTCFDTDQIRIPVVKLPFDSQGLLLNMQGLEEQLAGKDLVFSADITYQFSAQAVHAKRLYGYKVVCLEWENIPFNYEEYEAVHNIKETVRRNADYYIAVTERAKEALMLEGIPSEMIDVVPMGIDLKRFRPRREEDVLRDRHDIGVRKDEIVVLFVGRMVWEKGVYDFVHAAARILSDRSLNRLPVRFLMVGKGPEFGAVQERAMSLGIFSRFMFMEGYPYEEMHKLHNLADIFVLPSISTRTWQEQFGMVLIESMACGKPVVSTYSGSIPEVVGDAGILVQSNDHVSLYNAIKRLMSNAEFRKFLGNKALIRAETEFDSEKIADKVKGVFDKVLNKRSAEDRIKTTYAEGLQLWRDGYKEVGFQMVCDAFGDNPDNTIVLDSLVSMGTETGKLDVVEKALREYLNYHPADLDRLTILAEVLLRSGYPSKADEELQKVFLFDPENQKAAALMEKISAS
jgi:glycosyltransferase involved in cell wall biosynthesis/2-polyprenyl-3-methyl-5-hydroxy-6-metoxy-1,4-benzoquinol methylase